MIRAVVICNTSGKPRLIKFYDETTERQKQEFLRDTYSLLHKRTNSSCNFLEAPTGHDLCRIIYRQYSTIYIIFCVDFAESELGILDLIQVFVDLLDKTFENVCELDLIFNADKVHYLLNELICGGIVLETNHTEILNRFNEQQRLGRGSTDSADFSNTKTSFLSNRILSGMRAGSSLIASVVPSSSAKDWVSALASSATSLRISNRLGFQSISEYSEDQHASGSRESEKLCL
ncbi:AP-3 complex subunit sigma-2 [Taenia crassiceps]|uniref:AP-3 complex subunit sigma-2 n=1 Tax=Taenia crassiceps TaxID=6207 RepID=A0ABR4Q362_9CEST